MTSRHAAVLGVDVGGTFTDVVLEFQSRRVAHKVLTTPREPEQAIIRGVGDALAEAGVAPRDVTLIIHGTTLLTNALIERKGPRIAFVTTEGHRDTLEIATESRFHLYDLNIDKPVPLVSREWRLPVRERLDVAGRVLVPLNEADVSRAAERIAGHGITSVAIGFLHSYTNPAHERRAAEIVRSHCGDIAISLSSEVAPEIREYDRFNTVCANAFVKPTAAAYLTGLRARLSQLGFACPVLLMHSGGGMIDIETAIAQPIRLLESGPAGGAVYAASVARQLDITKALCFDMGGTTAKICFIDNFAPRATRHFELDRVYRFLRGSGLPVRIPAIELVEIGAGGGSIASVDRMGGIAVGPESAGADPGPASYGLGEHATVTDANLVLGRIQATGFAGGTLVLDARRAENAIAAKVARPLGVDNVRAAAGVVEIVDENMANAARVHALESGRNLSDYTLIAFGGAGPLHAARMAGKLGIGRIVVPADAGVGSAIGFLRAPVAFELVRSLPMRLADYISGEIASLLDAMTAEANVVLSRAGADGMPERSVASFMRYVGQGHELEIAIPAEAGLPPSQDMLRDLFEAAYEAMFARRLDNQEIEILSWRVRCALPPASADGSPPSGKDEVQTNLGVGTSASESAKMPAHVKGALASGVTIPGPAVIVDRGATVLVPSGYSARLIERGHIDMTLSQRESHGRAH